MLAVITGGCHGGRELPEHWVQYLDYLVAQFDLLPCPRPTSIIAPGTLGHPFHTHAEEVCMPVQCGAYCSAIDTMLPVGNIVSMGILVLEILVRRTKFSLENMVRLCNNWSGLKTLVLRLLSLREHNTTSSSTKGSLGNSQRTWRSPKSYLQWQAESATLSF